MSLKRLCKGNSMAKLNFQAWPARRQTKAREPGSSWVSPAGSMVAHPGLPWKCLETSAQFNMSACQAASARIWNTLGCALGAAVPAVWGTQKGARATGTFWKRLLH